MPTALVVHPSAELYGSDRVALETVIALAEAGWTVHVALAGEGPLATRMRDAGGRVVVLPVPVLRKSALSPIGLIRLLGGVFRAVVPIVRMLRSTRADVVYVSTVTLPWWLALARLSRRRVVCHVHEAEEEVPAAVRLGLAAPLLLAHRVIANSAASRAVVTDALPLLAGRVHVLYNGVPGPRTPTAPRAQLSGPVRLVLVGRVSPRKGTDVAVAALARLRTSGTDARLDLVGGVFPGYEWFETRVRDDAARLGVQDAVTWRGTRDDVWAELAAADVALVPSRVEPFGNAAVEAMLAQRPVVAGDTQGLREIVRPGDNGELAAPGDAEALAAAIGRLVGDWPRAVARAAAARAEAEDRFSPGTYRHALVKELESVTPGDPNG